MPGPNSAPNGDRSIVHGWTSEQVTTDGVTTRKPITVREKMRKQGKLRSGKTDAKRKSSR